MSWNVSSFNQFLKTNPKGIENNNKQQNMGKTPPGNILGSNYSLDGKPADTFTQQTGNSTNPFYTNNRDLQKYIKPQIKQQQAALGQPVQSQRIMQDSCAVSNVAKSLLKALEVKDPYTKSHSKAVKNYSKALAENINLSKPEVELISLASVFHDIGKIGVPETILHKESKLDDNEYNQIKKHPEAGSKILEGIPTFKGTVSDIVRHHHENWDGTGYPDGLSGKSIPLGARIVAIADTYHAMTSDRPYRKGLPQEEAVRRLKEGAGSQWDPALVNKFIGIVNPAK